MHATDRARRSLGPRAAICRTGTRRAIAITTLPRPSFTTSFSSTESASRFFRRALRLQLPPDT